MGPVAVAALEVQSAEPRFYLHDLKWELAHFKQQQTAIFPGRSCIPGSWQALPPPWPWHSPTASQAEQNLQNTSPPPTLLSH